MEPSRDSAYSPELHTSRCPPLATGRSPGSPMSPQRSSPITVSVTSWAPIANAPPQRPYPVLGDMNLHRPRRSCLDPMRIPVLGPKCSTCPSGCVPFLFTRFACALANASAPLSRFFVRRLSWTFLTRLRLYHIPLLLSRSHSFPRGCALLTRSLSLSQGGKSRCEAHRWGASRV